jgi:hypothetical protein
MFNQLDNQFYLQVYQETKAFEDRIMTIYVQAAKIADTCLIRVLIDKVWKEYNELMMVVNNGHKLIVRVFTVQ